MSDFPISRYDWDTSGNIIYKGELVEDGRNNRRIYKIYHFQYDSSNNLIKKYGPKLDNWEARTSLNWT